MLRCLIGLGSNLGDRRALLDRAVARLAAGGRFQVVARSRPIETAPVGGPPGQPPFLNAALVSETSLGPGEVLAELHQIEAELGRRRDERWAARTVDLDLLLYGDLVLDTERLVLPHPRMAFRRFVLEPAAEVAAEMVHPVIGWTIAELLDHLNTAAPYVAIAGAIGAGKTLLAEQLAERLGAVRLDEEFDAAQLASFYADPAGNAWAVELEFLRRRTEQLAAGHPRWLEPRRAWVSDYWFDQSLAFAAFWLPADLQLAYRRRWDESWPTVQKPKLIVLLDAPADELVARIRRRQRPGEERLDAPTLDRLREAILALAARPKLGPVLRAPKASPEQVLAEAAAAIEAMQPPLAGR